MVCKKCEAKSSQTVICPDVWKEGASNTTYGKANLKINRNALLGKGTRASAAKPYQRKCKICKQQCNTEGSYYCQACAYSKGICAMCGVKVVDTKMYRMRSVWFLFPLLFLNWDFEENFFFIMQTVCFDRWKRPLISYFLPSLFLIIENTHTTHTQKKKHILLKKSQKKKQSYKRAHVVRFSKPVVFFFFSRPSST